MLRLPALALITVALTVARADATESIAASTASEVFVQTGHSLMATRTAFSPDGNRLATCDGLGRVIIWDVASGRQVRELERHIGLCQGLAYVAGGKVIASAGGARSGNEIRLHRAYDGQVLSTRYGHNGHIREVATAPDGRTLWSLGENDGLKQWAIPDAVAIEKTMTARSADKPLRAITLEIADVEHAAFTTFAQHPRAARAWIGRADGKLLEIDTGIDSTTPPRVLWQGGETISGIAVSPQGDVLALTFGTMNGSRERAVLLLASASGETVGRLEQPQSATADATQSPAGVILRAAFSPRGDRIAAISMMDLQALLQGNINALRSQESVIVWSREGRVLAQAVKGGATNGLPFLTTHITFDRSGERIAIAAWDTVPRLYTLSSNGDSTRLAVMHELEGRGQQARRLAAARDAPLLVTADAQPRNARASVRITPEEVRREFGADSDWNAVREQRVREVYGTGAAIAESHRASLWNLTTGRLDRVVPWQRAQVTHLQVANSGEIVSYAPLFPSTIVFSPLKSSLVREARIDAEGAVKLNHFDLQPTNPDPMQLFHAPAGSADAALENALRSTVVVASVSGQWIALDVQPTDKGANRDRTGHRMLVMEQTSGVFRRRLDLPLPGSVLAATISADARRLWVVCSVAGLDYQPDHESRLLAYELPSGAPAGTWTLSKGVTASTVVSSPDGNRAYTSGQPRIPVWAIGESKPVAFLNASPGRRNVTALALNESGDRLIAADATSRLSLWDSSTAQELWSRQLPGASPHSVHFALSDTRIVAATNDGTVHLIETANGAPVARMIRFDDNEWITILPEGYFVASHGGDRWLNVRVNDTIYGIDQFFDVFYRPDIVERRLAGESIQALITVTLEDALRQPPPRLTLEATAGQDDRTARIKAAAFDAGGQVGELRVFHNGKLVDTRNRPSAARRASDESPPAAQERIAHEIEIALVPGANVFTLMAFNGGNTLNARPISREINAKLAPPVKRIVILSMGINEYRDAERLGNLRFAVKDADDFSRQLALGVQATDPHTEIVHVHLRDRGATREQLRRTFAELEKLLKPTDIFIWFVASHGMLDDRSQFGIVTHEWNGKADAQSLLSADEILEASRRLSPLTQFFIFDTCHSGGISSLVRGLYDARLAVLARNMGLHIFASASATEEAIDGFQGNGLFTHTLLKGLVGNAADANQDRKISVLELGQYASVETARIARTKRHLQNPLIMSFGKDWVLRSID